MLFSDHLDSRIFSAVLPNNQLFDEIVILSGYVNPGPMKRLAEIVKNNPSIHVTVIYGMYGHEGISNSLHRALTVTAATTKQVSLLYSTTPVHAKCYLWRLNQKIVYALVGSANFTQPGLTTPLREVLEESPRSSYFQLDQYLRCVLSKSILPKNADVTPDPQIPVPKRVSRGASKRKQPPSTVSCRLNLFFVRAGKKFVHPKGGLNWGYSKGHVARNDAYIPIPKSQATRYPNMFKKGPIEIVWDDGCVMTCKMEGNEKDSIPKQISSTPRKADIGEYFHKRLGVPLGSPILLEHLVKYGRDNIDIAPIGDRLFYCDFSTAH